MDPKLEPIRLRGVASNSSEAGGTSVFMSCASSTQQWIHWLIETCMGKLIFWIVISSCWAFSRLGLRRVDGGLWEQSKGNLISNNENT